MNIEFKNLYLTMVKKMWDIEDQLVRHLPRMAEQATSKQLHDAILAHLEETKTHRDKLTLVLERHEELQMSEPNPSFESMLAEHEAEASSITDFDVRDAYIIAATRTVEHFEISKYLTLVDWASNLEDAEGEAAYEGILNEEKAADDRLATIETGGLLGLMGEGITEKAAV